MGPSLYSGISNLESMNAIVLAIVEKYTDPDARMPYLYNEFLTKEYSPTGTYTAISESITNFMLDVVSTDAKLPLKNRQKAALLQGFIPKMGNKMQLNEQQLQDLDTAMAVGNVPLKELLAKLFADADRLLFGAFNRNEYIFLQALSTGKAKITDADNVGVQFEADFGFLPKNKSYANVVWGGPTATPFTDLQNAVTKAENDGVVLTRMFCDGKTFAQIMNSAEVKAIFENQVITREKFRTFLLTELGLEVRIVNRVVTAQIDGKDKDIKAWAEGQITLTAEDKVGKLVWTRTAEFNHRVGGVMYSDADGGTFLVSKYGTNDPVSEFTSLQGRCLPVIANVQKIYQLDTTKTSA